jgi:membrane associated rhomboid family serine protease
MAKGLFFAYHEIFRTSYLLFAAMLIVSVLALVKKKLIANLALHPYSIVNEKEYYRLLTSDLVHNDLLHLFINSYMYLVFCVALENQLIAQGIIGEIKFLAIYGSSLLAGGLFITVRHYRDLSYSNVGASGTIMGCMFSCMILNPKMTLLFIPGIGGINNMYSVLIYMVFLAVYSKRTGAVNQELHFAGALGGILATLLLCSNFFK